ncbi:alpha/beta hydrolase [Pistricoccus aurantiacus]|uniref:Alpha/beta hydrolase n=1 Tax=Pistricoccus aurantiacus TaxID=1883414 RepID=A0A5B8SSL2_9GAMM|nr:alpha/beta hydrolase [Pistricoccus aurantiacus]QEA38475.1 alpha/beta hydrolase [Pistricoccus aurantiacus]
MTDFTALKALGELAPIDTSRVITTLALGDPCLTRYLDCYRLTPLLSEHVVLYAGFVDTPRYRLWCQVWGPPTPQGTVFVVHGYFDHLGLYGHLLELLLRRGWQVVLWDLPGHGLSSGAQATIDDFDDYGHCLHALKQRTIAMNLAPRPWLGIGQSTGAAILATDALTSLEPCPWAGLALLAPLVRPWGWNQARWLHLLAEPFINSLSRRYQANSTDQDFTNFLQNLDPLQADHLPVSWISAMRRWIPRLLALPPSQLPVLILQGEQDQTVDWSWNLEVLQHKFPQATLYQHPQARHHLVNEAEPIRQALFERLEAFLADFETEPLARYSKTHARTPAP